MKIDESHNADIYRKIFSDDDDAQEGAGDKSAKIEGADEKESKPQPHVASNHLSAFSFGDDRFYLDRHAPDLETCLLLFEALTLAEANTLKTAMSNVVSLESASSATPAAPSPSSRGTVPAHSPSRHESKGTPRPLSPRDAQMDKSPLANDPAMAAVFMALRGADCNQTQFIDCYLKSVSSVSFQRNRGELLDRLERLYSHFDPAKTNCLRFRDVPALRTKIEGVDFSAQKLPVTSYTETGINITAIDFAASAFEENDAQPDEDAIPPHLQNFTFNMCGTIVYHPYLERFTMGVHNDIVMFTVDPLQQKIVIYRVMHGRHSAPITAALHVPQVKALYSSAADRTVCAWIEDDKFRFGSRARLGSAATCMSYDPHTQILIVGATDGYLYLLPTIPKLLPPLKRIAAHADWVMGVTVIADLEQVASCGADGFVKVWTSLFELRSTKSMSGAPDSPRGTSPQRPRSGKSSRAPSSRGGRRGGGSGSTNGSGQSFIGYSSSQRSLFTIDGGRDLCCWNVFLNTPTDVLAFHDKMVVGLHCFKSSHEVITADISGRIGIWDITRATAVQKLGGPESETPCGTINSIAYDPIRGCIVVIGARMTVFYPEQGVFSPLFETPVLSMHYAPVSRSIVAPTGNRIIVLDIVTGSTKNIFYIGTDEATASCMALREMLLLGTSEGRVMVSGLGHWRPQHIYKTDDLVKAIYDLGEGNKLCARGETNSRVLCVSRTGSVTHVPFGSPMSGNAAPARTFRLANIELVNCTAFSSERFLLAVAGEEIVEVWDLPYAYQKMCFTLPAVVTAMECVDTVAGLFIATASGCIHVYHTGTALPVGVVNPLQASPLSSPRLLSSASPSAAVASTEVPAVFQMAFNPSTCTLLVVTGRSIQALSLETLVQLLQRNSQETVFTKSKVVVLFPREELAPKQSFRQAPGSASMPDRKKDLSPPDSPLKMQGRRSVKSLRGLVGVVQQQTRSQARLRARFTVWVDTTAYSFDRKPLAFTARWQGKRCTLVVAETDDLGVRRCVDRIDTLRTWCNQMSFSHRHNADGGENDEDALMDEDGDEDESISPSPSPSGGRHALGEDSARAALLSVADAYILKPYHFHPPGIDDEVLPGLANHCVYSICESFLVQRAAIDDLEKHAINHTVLMKVEALKSIKWMTVCVASALAEIHRSGKVALFSQSAIRFVSPYFKLCLEHGLWTPTEEYMMGAAPPAALLEQHSTNDSFSRSLALQESGEFSASSELFPLRSPLSAARQQRNKLELEDARRHVPDIEVPPEGMKRIAPAIDTWILGLTIFRVCSAKSFDAQMRPGQGGGFSGPRSAAGASRTGSTFELNATLLHPSVRHDPFLMTVLRGLLTPDPEERISADDVLLLAADCGFGIKAVARSEEGAAHIIRGGRVDAGATLRGKKGKKHAKVATFEQQFPAVVIPPFKAEGFFDGGVDARPGSGASCRSVNSAGSDGGPSEEWTLLQFAPPAHVRVPVIPQPNVQARAGQSSAEDVLPVSVGTLQVLKAGGGGHGLLSPRKQRKKPRHHHSPDTADADRQVSYVPVLRRGRFTAVHFMAQLQLFMVAEFDRSIGQYGCGYITVRRNLTAASFTQAHKEYQWSQTAFKAKPLGTGVAIKSSPVGVGAAGVSAGKQRALARLPHLTLVISILPPHNEVQVLGGIDASHMEATVSKRAASNRMGDDNEDDDGANDDEKSDDDDLTAKERGAAHARSGEAEVMSDSVSPRRKDLLKFLDKYDPTGRRLVDLPARVAAAKSPLEGQRSPRDEVEKGLEDGLKTQRALLDMDDDILFAKKNTAYNPERYCPFFTDAKAMADVMGMESTMPSTTPFYMHGWHRTRAMRNANTLPPPPSMPPAYVMQSVKAGAKGLSRTHATSDPPQSSSDLSRRVPEKGALANGCGRARGSQLPPLRTFNHREPISIRTSAVAEPVICVTNHHAPKKR